MSFLNPGETPLEVVETRAVEMRIGSSGPTHAGLHRSSLSRPASQADLAARSGAAISVPEAWKARSATIRRTSAASSTRTSRRTRFLTARGLGLGTTENCGDNRGASTNTPGSSSRVVDSVLTRHLTTVGMKDAGWKRVAADFRREPAQEMVGKVSSMLSYVERTEAVTSRLAARRYGRRWRTNWCVRLVDRSLSLPPLRLPLPRFQRTSLRRQLPNGQFLRVERKRHPFHQVGAQLARGHGAAFWYCSAGRPRTMRTVSTLTVTMRLISSTM